MKPVVSSIIALAIAIAPFAAYAAPESAAHKPTSTKVEKHHKKTSSKTEKSTSRDEKVVKNEKEEKEETITRVHHSSTSKVVLKPVVLHHAHNADVSGPGHKEPKADKDLVPASLTTKTHTKTSSHKAETKSEKTEKAELPKLPDASKVSVKAGKNGSEKGARKATEKKEADSDEGGQPKRDEDFADLVARIRGKSGGKEGKDEGEAKDAKARSEHEAGKPRRVSETSRGCEKDPIEVIRGPEIDTFALTRCDGTVAPLAVEHLSIAIRPGSAARPVASLAELAKKKGEELAHGVHRVDERLAQRIQALADHFGKPGAAIKMSIVSGVRPTSVGSMHATGRAVDFRIEGTKNEDVVAFCKTLTDTGCGYYPNSSFVHLDVRDPGKGHVAWIDASGPGETPRYVSAWPPKSGKSEALERASAKEPAADEDGMPEAVDEHPADTREPNEK
ncbi:MAG: Ribonuclease [Labilithrix sp.]|nr:Ribonuclease [Labilithrix sp.]